MGCLSQLATIATALAAGLGYFSFWWVLIPAFVASAFTLTKDQHHAIIMRANAEGRLYFFPGMLVAGMLVPMALAGAAFWAASALRSG